MPDENAHIALARHNQDVIDYLSEKIDEHSDWVVTVAFYKAIHIVEAIFARTPGIRHGRTHEARDLFLKRDNRFAHIYKHYRPLWAASIIARYLESSKGVSHASFSQYLSPRRVRREMLYHRLYQIEKSAKKFLSKRSCEALDKVTNTQ